MEAIGKRLDQSIHGECLRFEIEPETSVSAPTLSVSVTFFIFNATGILIAYDQQFKVQPDDLIELSANVQREWFNNGHKNLDLLIIKNIKDSDQK